MKPTAKPLAVMCLTLALAGCGSVQWSKAGSNEQAVTADLTACGNTANATMNRLYGPELPTTNFDPRFGPDMSRPSPADRRLEQQEAVNRCMREKGYALEPAK
jgi:hypothetical protein